MSLVDHFQHCPSGSPRLRVGVLLDGDEVSKPFADVLTHIVGSDFCEPVVRIYHAPGDQPPPPKTRSPFPVRVAKYLSRKENRQLMGWTLYDKLDGWFGAAERAALPEVDIRPLLGHTPRIDVVPISNKFVHRFPPEAVQAVNQYQLDVILRFGFNVIRGDILKSARYGLWSYHHSDNDFYRGGPSPFWELVERHPCSGVMLQILDESIDAGYVLCKGLAPTENTMWLSRNRPKPFLLGTTFIIRKLYELHRDGFSALQERSVPPAPYQGKRKVYKVPTNGQMARFMAAGLARAVADRIRPKKEDRRTIGFRKTTGGFRKTTGTPGAENATQGADDFRWADVPNGRRYGRPVLIEKDAQVYCFFEDTDNQTGSAKISCGLVMADGALTQVQSALDPGFPVSHPFMFKDGENIYMIPANPAAGTVDLYRAVHFPERWEKVSTLLCNVRAVHTTLLNHVGNYWLFVTIEEPAGAAEQLALLHAESLTGPYTFHPETVICADSRYARGAGRLFEVAGELIRPCQDATTVGRNGPTIHFRRVTKLSTTCYREELYESQTPSYDRCGDWEAIDSQDVV